MYSCNKNETKDVNFEGKSETEVVQILGEPIETTQLTAEDSPVSVKMLVFADNVELTLRNDTVIKVTKSTIPKETDVEK